MSRAPALLAIVLACGGPAVRQPEDSGEPATTDTETTPTTPYTCPDPGGYDEAAIPLVASGEDLVGVPAGAEREQLLVFLHGTGQSPDQHEHLLRTAVWAGYRTIGLQYQSNPDAESSCTAEPMEQWAACAESISAAKTYGAEHAAYTSISDEDSIVGRLHARLTELHAADPAAGWDRFFVPAEGVADHEDYLVWSDIVLAGFSQGAAHGTLLARDLAVHGQVAISGPPGVPEVVPWAVVGATPGEVRFGASHAEEGFAEAVTTNFDAMGLVGEDVTIALPMGATWDVWPPFEGAARLVSELAPAGCVAQDHDHASMATDACMNVADAPEGDAYALFRPYLYLLCAAGGASP